MAQPLDRYTPADLASLHRHVIVLINSDALTRDELAVMTGLRERIDAAVAAQLAARAERQRAEITYLHDWEGTNAR